MLLVLATRTMLSIVGERERFHYAMYTANTVYTCGVEHVNSAHAHCVKCRDVTVKKKRVETFRKIYGMVGSLPVAYLYILGECWTLLASGSEARY